MHLGIIPHTHICRVTPFYGSKCCRFCPVTINLPCYNYMKQDTCYITGCAMPCCQTLSVFPMQTLSICFKPRLEAIGIYGLMLALLLYRARAMHEVADWSLCSIYSLSLSLHQHVAGIVYTHKAQEQAKMYPNHVPRRKSMHAIIKSFHGACFTINQAHAQTCRHAPCGECCRSVLIEVHACRLLLFLSSFLFSNGIPGWLSCCATWRNWVCTMECCSGQGNPPAHALVHKLRSTITSTV